jgi:hypothetical protein
VASGKENQMTRDDVLAIEEFIARFKDDPEALSELKEAFHEFIDAI